jgi:hypothetical protein
MPLFDWDADNGSSVFKAPFKYYWTVTLPLTFILILIWSLILLFPWKKWIPWQKANLENGPITSITSQSLNFVIDNDRSRSLVDD